MNRILSLLRPSKRNYYQLSADGRIISHDSPVFWLRWAQNQNPIVDYTESFHGETQVAVLVEFRACDPQFAQAKWIILPRKFYRVSVLGGPLDGRTRKVRTLEQAQKLMQDWSNTSWTMLDTRKSAG